MKRPKLLPSSWEKKKWKKRDQVEKAKKEKIKIFCTRGILMRLTSAMMNHFLSNLIATCMFLKLYEYDLKLNNYISFPKFFTKSHNSHVFWKETWWKNFCTQALRYWEYKIILVSHYYTCICSGRIIKYLLILHWLIFSSLKISTFSWWMIAYFFFFQKENQHS